MRYLSTKRNRWYERNHEYFSQCVNCGKKKSKTLSKNCLPCRDILKSIPIEKRFEKFVQRTESCWIWVGSKNKGYGQLYDPSKRRPEKASRISWEIKNGKIPDGIEILHNCPGGDNPSCVNPDHLKLGTHAENMADAQFKNQMVKGEDTIQAKLKSDHIGIIRRLYYEGVSRGKIAKAFGVTSGTIQCVIEGKTWKHVS